jgi:hypothetical protein
LWMKAWLMGAPVQPQGIFSVRQGMFSVRQGTCPVSGWPLRWRWPVQAACPANSLKDELLLHDAVIILDDLVGVGGCA